MSRQKIAAGNWKMNTSIEEGLSLAKALISKEQAGDNIVIIAPPFTHLHALGKLLQEGSSIKLAAQNCGYEVKGAYTGEVSVDMLKPLGVEYVIVGHSERRQLFGETYVDVSKKINQVVAAGMNVIFCCGETKEMRESKQHMGFVRRQLESNLFHLFEDEMSKIVIAYEPIWAIGTGLTASPEQAQEMHQNIRSWVADQYGESVAAQVSILYGGSVKPGNAKQLFSKADVDGGLVGGASLKADDFAQIIAAL